MEGRPACGRAPAYACGVEICRGGTIIQRWHSVEPKAVAGTLPVAETIRSKRSPLPVARAGASEESAVAAEGAAHCLDFGYGKSQIEQTVQADERVGGVGRAAPQAGPSRHRLVQSETAHRQRPSLSRQVPAHRLPRAADEIVRRIALQDRAAQREFVLCGRQDFQNVVPPFDRQEYGIQIVEAVRPFGQNLQAEVDFTVGE